MASVESAVTCRFDLGASWVKQGQEGEQEISRMESSKEGRMKHGQEVSSPPTKIQVDSVRWRVDRRWAQCHAICVCPP